MRRTAGGGDLASLIVFSITSDGGRTTTLGIKNIPLLFPFLGRAMCGL